MAKKQQPSGFYDTDETYSRHRAVSDEQRSSYLADIAFESMEYRIRTGQASAQELMSLSNYDPEDKEIERELAREKIKQIKAKTKAIESAIRADEMVAEAINHIRGYAQTVVYDDDAFDDYELYEDWHNGSN